MSVVHTSLSLQLRAPGRVLAAQERIARVRRAHVVVVAVKRARRVLAAQERVARVRRAHVVVVAVESPGVCWQPASGSHVSVVQRSLSLQCRAPGVCWQPRIAGSHGVRRADVVVVESRAPAACWQPRIGSHVSVVQHVALVSSVEQQLGTNVLAARQRSHVSVCTTLFVWGSRATGRALAPRVRLHV